MSIPRITDLLNKILSVDKKAILSTTYADNYIISGKSFQVQRSIEIGTETTVKFVIDFSEVSVGTLLFLLPLVLVSSAAPCHVKTYAISSYSNGTIYPSINLNSSSTNKAEAIVKHSVTSSDSAGDDLREYELGSSGVPIATRGGTAQSSSFLIIPRGAKLLMEVENYSTTASTFFNASLTWYEV